MSSRATGVKPRRGLRARSPTGAPARLCPFQLARARHCHARRKPRSHPPVPRAAPHPAPPRSAPPRHNTFYGLYHSADKAAATHLQTKIIDGKLGHFLPYLVLNPANQGVPKGSNGAGYTWTRI